MGACGPQGTLTGGMVSLHTALMRAWGRFRIAAVEAGRAWFDGGAIFGVVPRPLWSRFAEPDAHNRVALALRPLLILDDTRRILVDTGMGNKLGHKLAQQLRYEPAPGGIRGAVAAAGGHPDEITDVILTHLHYDHAGGATERRENGAVVPTFPRATYHLQRRALKWAGHAPEKDRRSFHSEDYLALQAAGQLHLLDGPTELFEGIELLLSEGHTVALQLPLIDGGSDGKLLFCGDIIPTRAHVQLPWIMAYDLYPLTTLEEKRLLLAQALAESWALFFEHDPEVAACKVLEEEGVVKVGSTLEL